MTSDIRRPGEVDFAICCLSRPGVEEKTEEREWATATRRVLLYLKALGVSPRDSLSLAQEALNRAERTPGSPPVQAAMVALKSLLHASSASGDGPSSGKRALSAEAGAGVLTAVPPKVPGEMTPARIDRRPWLTFLLRCTRHRGPSSKKAKPGRRGGRGSGPGSRLHEGREDKEDTGRAK